MATSSQQRQLETALRRAFAQAAWEQRQCAVTFDQRDYRPGPVGKNWEAHHVVEQRWIKGHKFPVKILWDPRNALRLRPDVHKKHTVRSEPVPIRALLDCNIEFAFEVMGPIAEEYLTRLYGGEDTGDRIKRASEVANKTMEDEIAAALPGQLWVPPHMRNR